MAETKIAVGIGEYVCVGGTFDRLHDGHRELLKSAVATVKPGGQMVIGITGDGMLQKKYLTEMIQPVGERMFHVREYLSTLASDDKKLQAIVQNTELMELADPYGPSITVEGIDTIVCSPETLAGASACNTIRSEKGFNPMNVFESSMVFPDDVSVDSNLELKLSSSALRAEELGKLLTSDQFMCRRSAKGPYTIGLTGGIACGKSTIAKKAAAKFESVEVIDCDKVGHQAFAAGTECQAKVIAHFGSAIVGDDGEIDRKKLGAIVFAEKANMEQLNTIVWPYIWQSVHEIISNCKAEICIVEAAILLEAGWEANLDEVWLVSVGKSTAIKRVMERNKVSEEEALLRVNAQPPPHERIGKCHVLISTEDVDHTSVDLQLTTACAAIQQRKKVFFNSLLSNEGAATSLPGRWDRLMSELAITDTCVKGDWWRVIRDKHTEAGRRYHNLSHLEELFVHYDGLRDKLEKPHYVELAIFFHDIIYNAKSPNPQNEMESAELFRKFWKKNVNTACPPSGFEDAFENVAGWIEMTANHLSSKPEKDAAYFLDFDLGILATDSTRYEEYAKDVQFEYQRTHTAEDVFIKGRTAFLESMLKRNGYYFTAEYKQKNSIAKTNMENEITSLQSKLNLK